MSKPEFVYVTYIRSSIDKVWNALTTPEFTRQYWFGIESRSTWTKGAKWELVASDGRVFDSGEILEVDRPRRVVIAWRHQLDDEMHTEGPSRATFDLDVLIEANPENARRLLDSLGEIRFGTALLTSPEDLLAHAEGGALPERRRPARTLLAIALLARGGWLGDAVATAATAAAAVADSAVTAAVVAATARDLLRRHGGLVAGGQHSRHVGGRFAGIPDFRGRRPADDRDGERDRRREHLCVPGGCDHRRRRGGRPAAFERPQRKRDAPAIRHEPRR